MKNHEQGGRGLPSAVSMIPEQFNVEEISKNGCYDLYLIGRGFLRDPFLQELLTAQSQEIQLCSAEVNCMP